MTANPAAMLRAPAPDDPRATRRGFLARLGALGALAAGASALGAAACRDGATDPLARASLGAGGPSGGLNLMYAYAQFMADFYSRAARSPLNLAPTNNFVGMTGLELAALLAIGEHKNAQRNALGFLIRRNRVNDVLLFDFATVDFSSRAVVMGRLQQFEDLGVAAANGVLATVPNAADATLVAKIAASWGRHAAAVRDLNELAAGNSNTAARTGVAATVDATGLDATADAAAVVAAIQPYLRTQLSAS